MADSTVLVVEDDAALREALCETLKLAGYRVAEASEGREALAHVRAGGIDIVVTDVQMQPMNGYALLQQLKSLAPALPVLFITAYATIDKAVEAIRGGAVDYLVKPFEPEVLVSAVERHICRFTDQGADLIAEDPATLAVITLAQRVAQVDATVMITGESGSGKEVIARYIHASSPRRDRPFVAINCAAIPENMLEATLFGYEKGAFTGAYQATPGKFELANGGTLMLDEVSEMALALQAKLLRVLQEREVERLGGRRSVALDVRVLATSNRDLRQEVSAGRFREDLYYRLNVFPLHLPPLRERAADLIPLARSFVARGAARHGRVNTSLSDSAVQRLQRHNWPGNVRELHNVIERALILARGDRLGEEHIQFEPTEVSKSGFQPWPAEAGGVSAETLGDGLRSQEERLILEALEEGRGSRTKAAEKLGISPRTLRYKLARMRKAGVALPG